MESRGVLSSLFLLVLSVTGASGACPAFVNTKNLETIVDKINAFRQEVSDGKHPNLPQPKRSLKHIKPSRSAEPHTVRSVGCSGKFPPDYHKYGGQEMHIFDLVQQDGCDFPESIDRWIADQVSSKPSYDFTTNSCYETKRHSCNMVSAMLKDFSKPEGHDEGWEMHCTGHQCRWGTSNPGRLLFCKLEPVFYQPKELTDEFLTRPYAVDGPTHNNFPAGYVDRKPESTIEVLPHYASGRSQSRLPVTLVLLGAIPCLAAIAGCYYRIKAPKEMRYSNIPS